MDYSQFLNMQAELSLLAVIVILFVADLFMCPDGKNGKGVYNTCLPVVLLTVHTLLNLCPLCHEAGEAFGGMYQHTPMMSIVKSILSIGTVITFLMAHKWLSREENLVKQGEFYLITLFTLLGMYFMISSGHFLMFFIGLETASIPMAATVAFDKNRYESAEASAKFILLALFSAALLLFGISLIYGVTGTLYFDGIGQAVSNSEVFNPVMLLGMLLFITGMGFKISLVPFHLWTADTYQGAPTAVTGYLSVVSKGAAAFALMTILMKVFGPMIDVWQPLLYIVIVLSITVANLFALRQSELKRFMAFSSISQAGYIMLAVVGNSSMGIASLTYYVLVYVVANMAVFTVISLVENNNGGTTEMDAYNGLYTTNPKLSFLMTLALFSLAGIPPFAGMFSKFFVFMAAAEQGSFWAYFVVFIALINTVASLYYYLLIVKAMYIKNAEHPLPTFKSDCDSKVALALCTAGILAFGVCSCIFDWIVQNA